MKIASLIIPVFNRRDTTLACLDSVYKYLPKDYMVIVSDAGSTDGTQAAIKESFPEVMVIQGDSRDWWTASTNRGIKSAIDQGCRFIVTFNDDNVAKNDVFSKLRRTSEEWPDTIVSSVVCYLDTPDKVFFAGRRRSKLTDRFFYTNHNYDVDGIGHGVREADLLHGMCTLFPVSVFQSVGFFDAKYFPHLFADDDLVLRAKNDGYRLLVDLDAVIYNDHTKKGVSPYHGRLGLGDIFKLFVSRKSAFQITTRAGFFWRHRRSAVSWFVTMLSDYSRVACIVILRWILSRRLYNKVEQLYLRTK